MQAARSQEVLPDFVFIECSIVNPQIVDRESERLISSAAPSDLESLVVIDQIAREELD
jgi:hypothetical protein